MTNKGKKTARHILWALVLATMFFAGWITRGDRSFRAGFETGYNAAANHISTKLKSGMKDLQPFYIADIGFRFSPRGYTIAGVRFIGKDAVYAARVEVPK